jgi:hypothetical protein
MATSMRRLALALCCLFPLAVPAAASAGDFNPAPGTYIVDTSTLTITGPGPTNITGVDQGGVAVFEFDAVNIGSGVTLNASGSRPLRIAAHGDLTLAGVINGNGTSPGNFNAGPGSLGGPGGGGGGGGSSSTWTRGEGIGGGGAATANDDGGGGGGFGGAGARGGTSSFNPAGVGGAAGPAYGSLDGGFVGGSGGSGSSSSEGGGGGGAIALFGRTVTITSGGQVHADGGGGAVGTGASGGGSGGGILVVGSVIDNQGQITARGGEGGAGGCCGDGGGGGGGRVAFRGTVLQATGAPDVSGGTSGTRGGLSHGALSPDFKGADGVVTRTTGTRVINFDDLTAANLFVNSDGPLRDRYAAQGVRFTGPAANDGGAILNVNTFSVNGQSGLNALAFNTGVTYTPAQGGGTAAGPETIAFDTPISTATVNTGQGAGGTATLTAFRGTTVVGSAFRTSTAALAPLTVNGEHITKLTLSFTGNAIVFDDLRWNTEPTSDGDSFSVNQGGTLNVGASGVLGNDSDPDGDPLTATVEGAPANGSVSLRPDGGFTYTPKSGFTGTDSFSYRAGDGASSGNSATVSISVVPTPPPPPPPPSSPPLLLSTISARWLPFRAYTKVLSLSVNNIPAGGQVRVQCKTKTKRQQGKGCPSKSKTYKVKEATRKLDLRKPFRDKKVPVKTKITITITAPGFTGKRFTYAMRPSKPPKPPKPVCILTSGKPDSCPS